MDMLVEAQMEPVKGVPISIRPTSLAHIRQNQPLDGDQDEDFPASVQDHHLHEAIGLSLLLAQLLDQIEGGMVNSMPLWQDE